ncbi:BatD family protein [Persicobacter sp. CCB-QB2]|uniref:BatD family protein n=1 Tax=Persicobacter sp. CCB-QB2 TaxID=1561025 RepID=UPI00209D8D0E|nr:BatD family protein [Persicobacter sp. CCB-QB2]
MRCNSKISYVLFLVGLMLLPQYTMAQDEKVSIILGSSDIGMNQMYTITIQVENGRLKGYSDFPEIEGFVMRGTSSSSSTNIVNGQISSTQKLTQNYAPMREGTYRLSAFEMTVNNQKISSPGGTIKVGPAKQQSRQRGFDPFGDPFGRDPFDDFFGRNNSQPQEFVDVKEDAFFALSTSKEEVYVGEGFNLSLAFYVAANNRAPMDFYQLPEQVAEMTKKIKPANCWEENFNIDRVQGVPVTINGKTYTQYKLYQATYFPLNTGEIDFPSLELKMIKYKVAKQQSFFGRNRKEDFKSFRSRSKKVKVKELPDHPLKDKVAVGRYRLTDKLSLKELDAGKSFEYAFTVSGRGNIAAIDQPIQADNKDIEFYPPNIRQNINRNNNRVTGSKTFTFYGIPREPGEYNLGDFFQWIYFDPDKETYDTLRPKETIKVTGKSQQFLTIESNQLGSFYDKINLESNDLKPLQSPNYWRWIGNTLILLLMGTMAFFLIRKP